MSQLKGSSSVKRKRPDLGSSFESLTDHERILYNVIQSKRDLGIWTRDLKRESNLSDHVVNKSLKSLEGKKLIKEVVNIQNKGRKHYMAAEFEPSKEITGGDWYSEGILDIEFIKFIKDQCLNHIFRQKVATFDGVSEWIRKSGIFTIEITTQQIEEILCALVLDNEITDVRSTGFGEFASIPVGRVCYRCTSKSSHKGEPKAGAMASVPCGVCPRVSFCTPDGTISPRTCVYYEKWLDF